MEEILGTQVEILDKKFLCKPTFKALVTIEKVAGCSLVKIFNRFANSDSHVTDVAAILYGCAKEGEKDLKETYEDFGNMVVECGVTNLLVTAFDLIKDCLSGPDSTKKKPTLVSR
jgi:hypothetical protein